MAWRPAPLGGCLATVHFRMASPGVGAPPRAATIPRQTGCARRARDKTHEETPAAMLWLSLSVKLVCEVALLAALGRWLLGRLIGPGAREANRSEEHTSELQSHHDLVC